jgi:hypothetical protein
MANNNNPFSRAAYSSNDYSQISSELLDKYKSNNSAGSKQTFTGSNLHVYINDIKVANLEAITWTSSREVVGNYVTGQAEPIAFSKGKRAIVGSIVLTQFDRHALLEEVFALKARNINNVGDIWAMNIGGIAARNNSTVISNATGGIQKLGTRIRASAGDEQSYTFNAIRGMSSSEYQKQIQDQIKFAAQLVASRPLEYSDELPPFDMTLIGVNDMGAAAKCSIFGVEITQETGGFSQNDMGNSVGMGYVARKVSRWESLGDRNGESFYN